MDWYGWPTSSDPASPWFVDPKVTEIIRRHPTPEQIARRDVELAVWGRKMYEWERDCRLTTALEGVPPALFVAAVALFVVGVPMVAAAVALLIPFVLMWRGYRRQAPDPGLPPPRLVALPFSDEENAVLLRREEAKPFRASSGCPGCGEFDTHPVIMKGRMVARKCLCCEREWAQQ